MPARAQVVLTEVDIAPAMKLHDPREATLPAAHGPALVLEVDHGGARQVVHLPARIPDPTAVVGIALIEQPLVEPADLLGHLAPDHDRGARHESSREGACHVVREMQELLP